MTRSPGAAVGFERIRSGRTVLHVRSDLRDPALRTGLDRAEVWERVLVGAAGSGRGGSVRRDLPGVGRVVLKRMQRGGLAGPLWRGRFAGSRRLEDNLRVADEAISRGIATAEPVAMLITEGPPGLFRGWMATREIEEAPDLLSVLEEAHGAGADRIREVLLAVRRWHDLGLDHPDLNVGNILVRGAADPVTTSRGSEGRRIQGRPRETEGWDVFVVDLDRARLLPGPLPLSARQSALRRLERSYVKRFGTEGPLGSAGPSSWPAMYAGQDVSLRARLESGRLIGRFLLAAHRLLYKS